MSVVYDEGSQDASEKGYISDENLSWSKSVCPYCGVGCGVLVGAKEGKVVRIRGNPDHPANLGMLCSKGVTLPQMLYTQDRLLFPQIRSSRRETFQKSSWDNVFSFMAGKISETIDRYGPDSFAFYISGQLLTEDYYTINKFVKGFLGTNNVDSNSRLCMASAVSGYASSLGADGPPAAYEDIESANCFFLIGTNMAACHPVTFQRIKKRKLENPQAVKLIVADPRKTATADLADVYLALKPGTDVALLNAMLHVLIEKDFLDKGFIQDHTTGWEELKNSVLGFSVEKAGKICGLSEDEIRKAAECFGQSKAALSFWSMGLNQSTSGVAKNNALINLHLATGKIGKPGSGPFSLTGQPNAMGGRETGGLAHLLPAHRLVSDPRHREEMEKLWEIPPGKISSKPGLTAVELFQSLYLGKVKIVWIIATNPMVSMPNLYNAKMALQRAELVIVQDAYHPTETTKMAHVLLPAAQWSERDGTLTNSERRISYLEKVVDPPGEAWPDWKIICELAKKMGFGKSFSFPDSKSIYEEYVKTTAGTAIDIQGVSHERLKTEFIQWPCPSPQSGSKTRLYSDGRFQTPDGRARFQTWAYADPAEIPDEEYPLILTTGRVRDQWHTMTRTGKIAALLKSDPSAFVEIHFEDARRLGLRDKDMILVITRRGTTRAPARLTDRIRQGTCFMPFHWGSLYGTAAVNMGTLDAFDPISKQPELKFAACRIEKAGKAKNS